MTPEKNILADAKALSKNPLGIIGLFLVLVYGMASLVITNSNLDSSQRQVLVYFIVCFPFLILFAFYRLVIKHHNKLYAPTDYKNEDNFVRTFDKNTGAEVTKTDRNEMQEYQAIIAQLNSRISDMDQKLLNLLQTSSSFNQSKECADIDSLVSQIKKSLEFLQETKALIDWAKYKIEVNDLLPRFQELKEALRKIGITRFSTFGSKSKNVTPNIFLLSVKDNVSVESLQELLKVLYPLGLQAVECYGPDDPSYEFKTNYYIGSYGYGQANDTMVFLNDSVFNALTKTGLTMRDIKEILYGSIKEF